jgi:iron-sulfur cluster assembly protein
MAVLRARRERRGGSRDVMSVKLSPTAVKRVKELMQHHQLDHAFLRLGVKGGGCSGFTYNLEFDNEVGKLDREFEIDGVRVVVDTKSYLYLNGSTLDYVTQGLSGGFAFVNPNAKSSCGCGTSFSV